MQNHLAVIIPAAGNSLRFGLDKLSAQLGRRTVLEHTIAAFADRDDVAEIILVGRAMTGVGKLRTVAGGRCRAVSVQNAVHAVNPAIEWVAVHDAARPLVSQELIDRIFAEARRHGAAAPALAVHLTIKQAVGPLPATVQKTIARDQLWAMQTPQIMRRAELLEAFARCPIALEQVTDDVQLLELIGKTVRLVEGDERNLKITRPIDLAIANMMLDR